MADGSPGPPEPGTPAPFDVEAARARYRRMMRGWPMRVMSLLTLLAILLSWVFAAAAAYAPDVDQLSGHGLSVPRAACIACHSAAGSAGPAMNHPAPPTCGFCHLQGSGR